MAEYEYMGYGSPDGLIIGATASECIGFYGKAPVSQRGYTSDVHATSALASSADFGATQAAVLVEVMDTLIGLGVWATA